MDMANWGSSMVSTIIGFGLSALFVAFILTRLLCRQLQRAESPPLFDIDPDPTIDVEQPRHRQTRGLEPVLVAEIPTAKFSRDTFSEEDAQCSICLGDYEEREVLRIMPKCGHNFHLVCIDIWLRKQSTCPVCRLSLKNLMRSDGMDPEIINLSGQWNRAENVEETRDRPGSYSSRSLHEIILVEPETGR